MCVFFRHALIGCFAACGGLDPDKRLSELNLTEAEQLCEDVAEQVGMTREVQCGAEVVTIIRPGCTTVTVPVVPAGCDVTVAEHAECIDLLAADPCLLLLEGDEQPVACREFRSMRCMNDASI